MKNEHQYQGAFSDFEEELDWNDFDLRTYDPQIGRWLQQDPYDEFSSPYVGMGNDPVNVVDPSGGSVFDGILKAILKGGEGIMSCPGASQWAGAVLKTGIFAAQMAFNGLSILTTESCIQANKDFITKSAKNNINHNTINGGDKNSIYLVFDGTDHNIRIYSNNGTDDLDDDELLGVYDAYNNVDKSSKGKWEDGEYTMEDQTQRHLHPKEQVDKYGMPVDTEDGMYGEGGIYRAKSFKGNLYTRSGMAIHAGRLHWTKGKNKGKLRPLSARLTMGCIRVASSTMNAIDDAIKKYGKLKRIYVLRNRNSTSSQKVNNITFSLPKETQSSNIFNTFFNWIRKIFSKN